MRNSRGSFQAASSAGCNKAARSPAVSHYCLRSKRTNGDIMTANRLSHFI